MVVFSADDLDKAEEEDLQETSAQQSRDKGGDALTLIQQEGKSATEHGRVLLDTINHAIGPLTPDLVFKNLVKDYKLAEQLFGESFIRRVAGYQPKYIKNNIHIPEFRRELKKNIESSLSKLHK